MSERPLAYAYARPHPAVTTDAVVFAGRGEALEVLLIRRGGEPFKGAWALPGGFLRPEEDLDACAARELAEEAGVRVERLIPFANFSAPHRDPRGRTISCAYYAVVGSETLTPKSGSDAEEARWFALDALPKLAFDHAEIIARALQAVGERAGGRAKA